MIKPFSIFEINYLFLFYHSYCAGVDFLMFFGKKISNFFLLWAIQRNNIRDNFSLNPCHSSRSKKKEHKIYLQINNSNDFRTNKEDN